MNEVLIFIGTFLFMHYFGGTFLDVMVNNAKYPSDESEFYGEEPKEEDFKCKSI